MTTLTFLHFLGHSATIAGVPGCVLPREQKRRATALRISRCAQRLTEERGLDGFTMDDLAEEAGVSRRTLFNYFAGKVDAVLGPAPVFDESSCALFVSGGPTGRLVDDCAVLAHDVLAAPDLALDREDLERGQRLMVATPRLLLTVHERFEQVTASLGDLVTQRAGVDLDQASVRLLVRLFATVLEASLAAYLAGDDRPLTEIFDETLRNARDLLT